MAVSLFGLIGQARAPKGQLVYCSYSKTGAAGLGKDYCELIAKPGAEPLVNVVLNEGNRFEEPETRMEYTASAEDLQKIQKWAKANKLHKLNGYNLEEPMAGGNTYRVYLEYDSGDSINIRWYGHGVDERALAAYLYIESFFKPWRERAVKESEPVTECFIGSRSTATRAVDACRLLCGRGFTPAVVIDLNVDNIHDTTEYHAQYNIDSESVQQLQQDLVKLGAGAMENSGDDVVTEGGTHYWAELTFRSGRKLSLSWHSKPGAIYDRLDTFFAPWKAKARAEGRTEE